MPPVTLQKFTISGVDDLIPDCTLTAGDQDPKNPVENLKLNKITKRYQSTTLDPLLSFVHADLAAHPVTDRSVEVVHYLGSNLLQKMGTFALPGQYNSRYRIRVSSRRINHRIFPSEITFSSNYIGSVTTVQENPAIPSSSDTGLLRSNPALVSRARFAFSGTSFVDDLLFDDQSVYVRVKRTGNQSTGVSAKLYENGSFIKDLDGFIVNSGDLPLPASDLILNMSTICRFDFNRLDLFDVTGGLVEIEFEGAVDIQAVMWNVLHEVDNDSGWMTTQVPSKWNRSEQEFYISYYPQVLAIDTVSILIEWEDEWNSDGIHKAGKLIAGKCIVPEFNMDWSPSIKLSDPSDIIPNAVGSSETFKKRRKKRGISGTLDDIKQEDAFRLFYDGLLRDKGKTGTFFATLDPTLAAPNAPNVGQDVYQALSVYGRLETEFDLRPTSSDEGVLLYQIPTLSIVESN